MSRALGVLGFAVSTQQFGMVYLEGGELMDWKRSSRASKSFEAAFKLALKWILYYRPDMVVVEAIAENTRKGARTRSLVLAVESAADNANVAHTSVPQSFAAANKYDHAAELARAFPQLAGRLPAPRRKWEREPHNIVFFEALSLALTWLRRHPHDREIGLSEAPTSGRLE